MEKQNNIIFREAQQFRQPWLWLIIGPSMLVVPGIFTYGIIKQVFFGRSFGNNPTSDTTLIIVGMAASLFCFGITALILFARLVTEVRQDGLWIRFVPFHRSWEKIPMENVTKCEARSYHPIGQYGGWGIRWAQKGRAYNVSGSLGVRLNYANGRHLLLGSQKPEQLAQAIESILRQRESNDK